MTLGAMADGGRGDAGRMFSSAVAGRRKENNKAETGVRDAVGGGLVVAMMSTGEEGGRYGVASTVTGPVPDECTEADVDVARGAAG